MTNYKFYRRDHNADTTLVAEADRSNNNTTWTKGKQQGTEILADLDHYLFNGPFDPDNNEHWKALPVALSGSRLWVAATS